MIMQLSRHVGLVSPRLRTVGLVSLIFHILENKFNLLKKIKGTVRQILM